MYLLSRYLKLGLPEARDARGFVTAWDTVRHPNCYYPVAGKYLQTWECKSGRGQGSEWCVLIVPDDQVLPQALLDDPDVIPLPTNRTRTLQLAEQTVLNTKLALTDLSTVLPRLTETVDDLVDRLVVGRFGHSAGFVARQTKHDGPVAATPTETKA